MITGLVNQSIYTDSRRTINWTNLPDGYYYYNVTLFDNPDGLISTLTKDIILDTSSPYFTQIPNNASLFYGNESLGVNFNAADNIAFGYYKINDTRFSITQTGFLSNATPMAVGNYEINVTINDTLNNINWTRYKVQINKSQETCKIFFNETSPLSYPNTFRVWANCTSPFTLYRNGTIIGNNSEQALLMGTYNFSLQRTDISNYSLNFNQTEFRISDYLLQIINPTTSNPLSVSNGQNISIYFNYTLEGVNVTSGLNINSVFIGGVNSSIIPEADFSTTYNANKIYENASQSTASIPPTWSEGWIQGRNVTGYNGYWNTTLSDNINYTYASAATNYEIITKFNFTITEPLEKITSITLIGEFNNPQSGGAGEMAGMHVANWSSNTWEAIGSQSRLNKVTRTITYTDADSIFNIIQNGEIVLLFEAGNADNGETLQVDYAAVIVNSTSPREFAYIPNVGWNVNVTVPSGLSGLKNLFVNATYSGNTKNNTQTNALDYGDITPPYFTTIPANASLFYGNQSLLVKFTGDDAVGFGYYKINDTRFLINQTGFLSNATPLAVGNYEINVSINDTYNNINWTRYKVQVNKSNYYDCGVYFNATSPINHPANFIVYTNCSSAYTLYRNGTSISNGSIINSGAGYYNLTVRRTDTQNYTNGVNTQFFTVNKNPEKCQVLFNETSPLQASKTFLVWANCTSPFTLYRNGTLISNNTEQSLAIGAYNFSLQRTDTSNYSINFNQSQFRIVDNAPPYFTTIPQNVSLFYGNGSLLVQFIATDETGFGYYKINDTRFSINQTGFLSNATPMAVGNYEINVTINDTSNNINWTRYKVQINKSTYFDCGVYFNTSSPIIYPDNFIVYTNCSSAYNLYRNGTIIANGTTINSGAGYYNLTVQRTDTANYTNTVNTQFFTINKNPENCQVLFNETSPLNYPRTFLVWANCTSPSVLSRNGTIISNNTEQALAVGAYNFSMFRTDVQNYSLTFNQSQFRIADLTNPIFTAIPDNASLFYGNESLSVDFDATDESTFGYYKINDTRFSITQTGILTNATPMAVGNYEINVSINDTYNNINWTRYTVQINKSNYGCNVLFNSTTPLTYPDVFLVYSDCNSGFTLYRNGTVVSNNSVQRNGVDYFNFTIQRADTTNYTNTVDAEFFTIDKSADACGVYFNTTSPITYPENFIVYTNCTSTYTLTRNGTAINNASIINAGAGYYNLTIRRTDNVNYTNTFSSEFFTVDKNTEKFNVLFNSTTPLTYPDIFIVYANSTSAFTLRRNGTLISNNSVQINGAGYFNFSAQRTDTANYSFNYNRSFFTVNKATDDCDVYFNATSPITFPSTFITYTNCTTAYTLTRNGTSISNSSLINSGAGYYNLTVKRTDMANYTNTVNTQFFKINKNPENCWVLFNETSPLQAPKTFLVWANCTSPFTLYRNGTLISNNTEQSLAIGAYNFSLQRTDTANYSINFNQTQFRIIDTIFPLIDYAFPTEANNENKSQNWIYVNVSLIEDNLINLTFYLYYSNYTLRNSSTYTDSKRSINFTSLIDGIYYYNVTAIDFGNNVNSTLPRKITLDTTNPNATLLTPTNQSYVNNATQNLTVNITDNLGLSNMTLSIYNQTSIINQTTQSISGTQILTGIVYIFAYDGIFKWFYNIFDLSGNSFSTENNTITIDTLVPSVNLENPINNSGNSDGNLIFYYNVSDSSTIDNCSLIFNGILNNTNYTIPNATTQSFYLNGLNKGRYNWSIICYDKASNLKISSIKYFDVIPATNFGGETTDFSQVDTSNIANLILERPSFGKINFSESINLSGGADLDSLIQISENNISIDTSLENRLNKSAVLYLYSLPYKNTPVIYSNGNLCSPNVCKILSYSGGNLTFNVSHFTSYGAGENSNLSVYDETDLEGGNKTKYVNNQIKFFANYTNITSKNPIDGIGVYCNISFNVSGSWTPYSEMIFNVTSLLYEYHRSFDSQGTFLYNVTCNGSSLGFESLNVTDSVKVTLDNVFPLIDYAFPTEANNENKSQNWVYVNVSLIENNLANLTFYLYYSNYTLLNSTIYNDSRREINWTNLNDGKYYYNVTAIDFGNNTNSTLPRKITLDNTNPYIIINYPINSSSIPDVTLIANITLNSSVESLWYSLNGGVNTTICNNCNGEKSLFLYLEEGEYELKFYANDSEGSMGVNSTSFSINMNNNYYDNFEDNSSIFSNINTLWKKGNVSSDVGFYQPNISAGNAQRVNSGSAFSNRGIATNGTVLFFNNAGTNIKVVSFDGTVLSTHTVSNLNADHNQLSIFFQKQINLCEK